MVDGFSADVEAVQSGVVDGRTPEKARQILAAALTYVVEPVDLMPDHFEGLGLIDDAAMLRLAARAAIIAGSSDPGLNRLAREAGDLAHVFGDLVGPLAAYLDSLQLPNAAGKTPTDIIADSDGRMELWKELGKRRETSRSHALVATAMDAGELVKTLRTLVRGRLAKKGLVATS